MNPHQKNKIDVSVSYLPKDSHASDAMLTLPTEALGGGVEDFSPLRQGAQQRRSTPEQAQGMLADICPIPLLLFEALMHVLALQTR